MSKEINLLYVDDNNIKEEDLIFNIDFMEKYFTSFKVHSKVSPKDFILSEKKLKLFYKNLLPIDKIYFINNGQLILINQFIMDSLMQMFLENPKLSIKLKVYKVTKESSTYKISANIPNQIIDQCYNKQEITLNLPFNYYINYRKTKMDSYLSSSVNFTNSTVNFSLGSKGNLIPLTLEDSVKTFLYTLVGFSTIPAKITTKEKTNIPEELFDKALIDLTYTANSVLSPYFKV